MSEQVATSSQPKKYELGQTIAKNALFITLGSAGLKALNFIFNVYIVRRLGDHRYGDYSTVLAFVGLFQIFAELGISQYVMREIARDRTKSTSYFWNLVAVRMLLALTGIAGITLGARIAGYSPMLVWAIFIYTCTFILAAIEMPLETILTANERLDYISALGILGQFVFVVIGGIFLLSGMGFQWLIVASLLSFIPQIALSSWAIHHNHLGRMPFNINPRTWLGMIKAGLPFGMISLALTITFNLDTVMLSKMVPNNVVAWYKVAYNLELSLLFFFTGFSVAIVPSLSRTYMQNQAEVERWYYRSVKFIMLLSLPVAVGGTLIAGPLIHFLYTAEFAPAASALEIIIWDVPVLMFAAFCGNMTTIVGEERWAALIYGLSAVTNIVLNLYAIPHYGILGAAVVTVATDVVSSVLFYYLLKRKLKLPDMGGIIIRVLIASGIMGVIVAFIRHLNLFIVIAAGMLVYAGLVFIFRMLDESEWSAILRLLRRGKAPQVTNEAQ